MTTRTERKLEKHSSNVVSIKDKIKAYTELLRQEEEKESEMQNMAIVELVRKMDLSYSDLKAVINTINPSVNAVNNGEIPEITAVVNTAVNSEKSKIIKEKTENEEEID